MSAPLSSESVVLLPRCAPESSPRMKISTMLTAERTAKPMKVTQARLISVALCSMEPFQSISWAHILRNKGFGLPVNNMVLKSKNVYSPSNFTGYADANMSMVVIHGNLWL